ncbi:M48 family metalloprotease [Actimicrobium sp. CCI2.3]|nr:M48 family metalloprotease [Actimicrobium sp. CCI2.3]MEB0021679.1 M48 family metalloprotease [Actimicrobium sp. CCI2.3]
MLEVVELTRQHCRSTLIALGVAALLAACATPAPTTAPDSSSSTVTKAAAPLPAAPAPVPVVTSAEETALRQLVDLQDRLDRVAGPLLVNNPALCKRNARRLLGFTAKTKYSYSTEFTPAAQKLLQLDERLRVTGVLPGSGADKVGVLRGDILLSVNEKSLPQGPNAERQTAALLAPMVTSRGNVKLTVLRNNRQMVFDVPLTMACAFRVELGNTDAVNAYSDGYRVLVTRGMLAYAKSDQDLAYVLAREMAHNALNHPVRLRSSATIAGVIDNLIRVNPDLGMINGTAGIKPYSQSIDAAADVMALFMTARAGVDIDGASAFWERLANQYPIATTNGYTALHPATTYRLAAIDKATADIHAKQAMQKPLIP